MAPRIEFGPHGRVRHLPGVAPIITFTSERGGIAHKKKRHDKLFRLFAGEIPCYSYSRLYPKLIADCSPRLPPLVLIT